MISQKINKTFNSQLDVAIKYYKILNVLNNLQLQQRQIELLAFTAIKGNISSGGKKEEFVQLFRSSKATIGNMVSDLKEIGLLIEEDGKTRVRKEITLDFSDGIYIQLTMKHGETTK